MPRYYFDLDTPTLKTVDDTGDMLASDEMARAHALLVLCETMRGESDTGGGGVVVTVRDREGPRFEARASISLEQVGLGAASCAMHVCDGSADPTAMSKAIDVTRAGSQPVRSEQEDRA
jgi:hypothetical protein